MATQTIAVRFLPIEPKDMALSLLADGAPKQALRQLGIEPDPDERSQLATWLRAMAAENNCTKEEIRDYVNTANLTDPALARFIFFIA
jgi:hypothetical protein